MCNDHSTDQRNKQMLQRVPNQTVLIRVGIVAVQNSLPI